MSRGLNHSAVMWMPTTNEAPTEDSTRRETNNCSRVWPKAKTKVGIAIATISTENTRRGPHLSSAMPTRMRAGMVSATLAMAKRRMSSRVSQSAVASIDEASGAMLNQT